MGSHGTRVSIVRKSKWIPPLVCSLPRHLYSNPMIHVVVSDDPLTCPPVIDIDEAHAIQLSFDSSAARLSNSLPPPRGVGKFNG